MYNHFRQKKNSFKFFEISKLDFSVVNLVKETHKKCVFITVKHIDISKHIKLKTECMLFKE